MSIPKDWRPIHGNTYSIREELQALGARWDRDTRLWWISPKKLKEAEGLIEERRRRL